MHTRTIGSQRIPCAYASEVHHVLWKIDAKKEPIKIEP